MYGTDTMDTIAAVVTTHNDIIRRHRDLLDLSREQLGARIGVSPQAIEKWEMTDTKPERPNAEKLDAALAAGGAILAACGYLPPVDWAADMATLRAQLGEVTRQLRELRADVDDLRRRLQ